ncbi:MAG: hypothetical protein ACRDRO_10005 [Pseudonocardiaceae bacterium]
MRTELLRPPWDWFQDPEFLDPHPVKVTGDGQVWGHLMVRTSRQAMEPGPSSCGYAYFHRNRITVTHDDTQVTIGVGQITMLDLTPVAYVRAGDDPHGMWVAGGTYGTGRCVRCLTCGRSSPIRTGHPPAWSGAGNAIRDDLDATVVT